MAVCVLGMEIDKDGRTDLRLSLNPPVDVPRGDGQLVGTDLEAEWLRHRMWELSGKALPEHPAGLVQAA